MIAHAIDQRTPEWHALRLGKLTSTQASDMMAKLRSGEEPARRRDLRVQLAVERLTKRSAESGYVNADMQRGIEMEPAALAAAEALLGRIITPIGFVEHDQLAAGCSPDGVVGDFQGIVEVKCPRSATHLSYWKGGVLPSEYLYQIIHQLWITGAAWCDFISYDDRFPPHLQVFHVRHERDAAAIDSYELLVRMFLNEVDKEVEALWGLMPAA